MTKRSDIDSFRLEYIVFEVFFLAHPLQQCRTVIVTPRRESSLCLNPYAFITIDPTHFLCSATFSLFFLQFF